MNNFDDLTRIAKVVNSLEKKGLFLEVDKLSNILTRLAQNPDPNADIDAVENENIGIEEENAEISTDPMESKPTETPSNTSDSSRPDINSEKTNKANQLYDEFQNFAKSILPENPDSPTTMDQSKLNESNLQKMKQLARAVEPYISYLDEFRADQITNIIPLVDTLMSVISKTTENIPAQSAESAKP
jgi:hypothetical protein